MVKKGYKAVSLNEHGIMYSWTTFDRNMGATRYYKGKITHRRENCGPLAVFDSIDNLKKFAGSYYRSAMFFECEYEPSEETCLWYMNENFRITDSIEYLPQGTVLADWVKLTKEIDL